MAYLKPKLFFFFRQPRIMTSWFQFPPSHAKLSSAEIDTKEMFLMEIRFLCPLRGPSVATMSPIHWIWKMT